MSSPYSSALLQDPPSSTRPAPRAPYTAPQVPARYAQPTYAPVPYSPPMVVTQAPRSGSKGVNAAGLMLTLVLAVAVGVGGWAIARYNSPTAAEINGYQTIAAQQGQFNGQLQGISDGKQFAENELADTTALKGEIAQAKGYNQGFNSGKSIGEKTPVYSPYRSGYGTGCGYSCGGGYGYGGYSSYGYGGGSVGAAVGQAQALADETGQEVDVDVN